MDLDQLREGVAKHKGDWVALAKEADVSPSWLAQFARGAFGRSGYVTLEKVAAALKRREAQ